MDGWMDGWMDSLLQICGSPRAELHIYKFGKLIYKYFSLISNIKDYYYNIAA